MRFVLFLILFLFPIIALSQNVAILEFKDKSSPPSVIAPTIVRRLFTGLFPPEEFTLIDRDLIRELVPRETQDELGEITPSMAALLGQVLSADILVVGGYQEVSGGGRIRGSVFINADFIDTFRSHLGVEISRRIMELFEYQFAREGLIEAVTDRIIILNIGGFHGVRVGDRFVVTRGEEVIGEIKVSRVERYMSEAMLVEGKEALIVGDVVRRLPYGPLLPKPKRALIIDSDPIGASITLNNQPRGMTPVMIYEPVAGVYRIELKKEGFRPFIEEIIIEEWPVPFLSVGLLLTRLEKMDYIPPPRASQIIVSSFPSNAKVYLERRLKGVTPFTLTGLKPGIYKIRVAKAGFGSVEKVVVLEKMETKRLNITLKPIPPLPIDRPPARPLPPPPTIIQVPTPYTQGLGRWYLALGYPDLLEFRQGLLIDGLEVRLEGFGFGIKYHLKRIRPGVNLGVDLYYGLRDMRRNIDKTFIDLVGIFGLPIDTGYGIINFTGGGGIRDEELRYFGGFDFYITPHLKFLAEYDRLDGASLGLRYDLRRNIRLTIGGGVEPDGDPRLDLYVSIQR